MARRSVGSGLAAKPATGRAARLPRPSGVSRRSFRLPRGSGKTPGVVLLVLAVLAAGYLLIDRYVPPAPGPDESLVVRVIDGDTVELADGSRVRYLCIDTPERGEPFYVEASERNRELVAGKGVRLEPGVEDVDRYGRLLRYVYVDGVFVNAELVSGGYARTLIFDEDEAQAELLRRLEAEAKAAKRGLWAPE
jgi:endonuclease YncB( thermonuclease family)